jgi:hypothetical protein
VKASADGSTHRSQVSGRRYVLLLFIAVLTIVFALNWIGISRRIAHLRSIAVHQIETRGNTDAAQDYLGEAEDLHDAEVCFAALTVLAGCTLVGVGLLTIVGRRPPS